MTAPVVDELGDGAGEQPGDGHVAAAELTDRNQAARPGRLLFTSDGGAPWQQIRF